MQQKLFAEIILQASGTRKQFLTKKYLSFSSGGTNRCHQHDGVAVHRRILPWNCAQQLHADRQRVFVTGEASGGIWLAHGRKSNFRHHLRAADRRHPRLDRILPHLHSFAERLHFSLHHRLVDRILHEISEAEREEKVADCDNIGIENSDGEI